jgi:signal recognition particle subunit SRP54
MAERILGMGDMIGLINVIKDKVDQEEQKRLQERLEAGEFTLDDFKKQIKQILQPGLMMSMMSMMPGMGQMKEALAGANAEGEMTQVVGIIDSMTAAERRNPKLIDPSRRNRIAKGAGVQVPAVNNVLKMYDTMAPMLKMLAGKGVGGRMAALQQMQNSGMLNPGAQIQKPKGDTGKRLTPQQRKEEAIKREKMLRKLKRAKKDGNKGDENDGPAGSLAKKK